MDLLIPTALQIDCLAELKEKVSKGEYTLTQSPKGSDFYDENSSGLFFVDLDDTLASSEVAVEGRNYDLRIPLESAEYGTMFRPNVLSFLNFLRHEMNCKVVLYTVGKKEFAEQVLNAIKFNFDGYLFRESCTSYVEKSNGNTLWTKDLSLFSSKMEKTILIDNSYVNSILCTYNVFVVKECTVQSLTSSRGKDTFFPELMVEMRKLLNNCNDWRTVVREGYNGRMKTLDEFEKEVYNLKRIGKYVL